MLPAPPTTTRARSMPVFELYRPPWALAVGDGDPADVKMHLRLCAF